MHEGTGQRNGGRSIAYKSPGPAKYTKSCFSISVGRGLTTPEGARKARPYVDTSIPWDASACISSRRCLSAVSGHLERVKTFVPGKPYWWQWPTVLSLDAPAVALLWQWLLMRTAGLVPRWPHAFILGISVWLAYAADRWIEGWRLQPAQIRTQRHYFYHRMRWPLAACWLAALAADLFVALRHLNPAELRAGCMLLVPVGLYLLSHQLIHRHHRWRAPKEICVALLFGAAATLFAFAEPSAELPSLAVPLLLFCLLCFANCTLISVWETEVDQAHGQTSLALQFRRARQLATILPWLLALGAAALALAHTGAGREAMACTAVGGVALGLVHTLHRRAGYQLARVLADVALMSPVFPWLIHVLRKS